MDMPTPKGTDLASEVSGSKKLAQLAKMLGCSTKSFFEQSTAGYPKDASLLIQTWLAIKSPKRRDAVFAFAREMLRSEKMQNDAERLASLTQIKGQRKTD